MAEPGTHSGEVDEPLDRTPAGPLLRDPPPPPGYTDPLANSRLLDELFSSPEEG